jgi:hypothetical protein
MKEYTAGFFNTSAAGANEGVGEQAHYVDYVKSLVMTVPQCMVD